MPPDSFMVSRETWGPEKSGKIGSLLAGKVIEEPGAKIR